MNENFPQLRRDLEFFPVQQSGQQIILIRDHLGLVKEGKAVAPHLYQFMMLLDGENSIRDLQMALMRQKGGVLVGIDEVKRLLLKLDKSYLLESNRFKAARENIVAAFSSSNLRPCSQCGRSYPKEPDKLKKRLDSLLSGRQPAPEPKGKICALVAPHIDPSAGYNVYASAYQMLNFTAPKRIVLLGVGHQMAEDLFCLTDKNFETPLGLVQNEPKLIQKLRQAGKNAIAATDFAHRSEHSLEFELIFLQHLLADETVTILPILCGSLPVNLSRYTRSEYLKRAGPFLKELREIIEHSDRQILLIAGVDFSHIGLKFGHDMPADYLESRTKTHDHNLLKHLCRLDADSFWQESISVDDHCNVCGFAALACLLEILPEAKGEVLDYELHHETVTKSAVSYAAVVFTCEES